MHRDFEEKLKDFLSEKSPDRYIDYENAKKEVEPILKSIVKKEPNLTDHSIDHVNRVLGNAYQLLGEDIIKLNPIELYALGISILFHDVGNVDGRESHEEKISKPYDDVRGNAAKWRSEKSIVLQTGVAHSGKASDGSYNTLKYLKLASPAMLDNQPVSICRIAAILRFADELDEGIFRTCEYALENDLYDEDSKIYHDYAQDTNVLIDRGGGRIVVKYNISIPEEQEDGYREELAAYLKFIYGRILKLNQERQYTKHYCGYLEPFKELSASFKFWSQGVKSHEPFDYELPPIVLNDLVIPKSSCEPIEKISTVYEIENVISHLLGSVEVADE